MPPADAWAALGYDSRALASAQKALSLSNGLPEDERMEIQGRFYELSHDWAGAIGVYGHLWQDFADDIESGLKLAAAEMSAGNTNEALGVLSNLRSLLRRAGLIHASISPRLPLRRDRRLQAATGAGRAGCRESPILRRPTAAARAKLVQDGPSMTRLISKRLR